MQSAQAYRGTVTLTYLSSDFDWRAHYVATLGRDGKTLSLFAWLTLANGDETSFADADTMAVAGRLNREYAERLRPETRSISLNCWPDQRTHETPDSDAGFYDDGSIPPPPPPPAPAAVAESIVVTGSRMLKAVREDLGDLKLYRIPMAVSVASRSQKQVAMIEQPKARFRTLFRWRAAFDTVRDEPRSAERLLIFENRQSDGLGLPLPSGSFTLYAEHDGRPFLVGEGRMTDRAVGEKVEVPISSAPGVRVNQRLVERSDKSFDIELVATNDQPVAVPFEAVFADFGNSGGQERPQEARRRLGLGDHDPRQRHEDVALPLPQSRLGLIDRPRAVVLVQGDEREQRPGHLHFGLAAIAGRDDLDANRDRRAPDALDFGIDADHVAQVNRLDELHLVDRDRRDRSAGAARRDDARGDIHLAQHPAAEDMAVGVDVAPALARRAKWDPCTMRCSFVLR